MDNCYAVILEINNAIEVWNPVPIYLYYVAVLSEIQPLASLIELLILPSTSRIKADIDQILKFSSSFYPYPTKKYSFTTLRQ